MIFLLARLDREVLGLTGDGIGRVKRSCRIHKKSRAGKFAVLIDRVNLYNCAAAVLEKRFDFPADRSSRVVLGPERQRREKDNNSWW